MKKDEISNFSKGDVGYEIISAVVVRPRTLIID